MLLAPQTIDDVIARLDDIVAACRRDRSRLGYFPALYRQVTREVRRGILEGGFEDGERLERVAVIFARRYLDAYEQYRRGERPTQSWQIAFEQEANTRLIVLQHLLLGMSAHINLDLGVAAAQGCPGEELPPFRDDFDAINKILFALLDGVQASLATISPSMWVIDDMVTYADKWLVNRRMTRARASAWRAAEQLALIPVTEQGPAIERLDRAVYLRGLFFIRPFAVRYLLGFIAVVENKNVVEVIDRLS
jgi:hypothetical protein